MTRGVGAVELLQDLLPRALAPLVALLTQLGDAWFLGLLLITLYWGTTRWRTDVVTVAGLTVIGVGLYRSLKEVFALPRPHSPLVDPATVHWLVRPVYEVTAAADGYGFPSGHATTATVVYLGLACVLAIGSRRRRFVAAGTLIAVVCFTRVALGVHYLVDVVAGVALGSAVVGASLWALRFVPGDRATPTHLAAVPVAATYAGLSDLELEALLLLGAALGTLAGWQLLVVGRAIAAGDGPVRSSSPLLGRTAVAALGVVASLGLLAAAVPLGDQALAVGGAAGLGAAGCITLPFLRYSSRARTVAGPVTQWLDGLRAALRERVPTDAR